LSAMFEQSSGNVYADLGYEDPEGMQIKAQLVTYIADIMKRRRWSLHQTATTLNFDETELSRLLAGQFRHINASVLASRLQKANLSQEALLKRWK
jgi:hypothetical protein